MENDEKTDDKETGENEKVRMRRWTRKRPKKLRRGQMRIM